jgi:hypothetical protein
MADVAHRLACAAAPADRLLMAIAHCRVWPRIPFKGGLKADDKRTNDKHLIAIMEYAGSFI